MARHWRYRGGNLPSRNRVSALGASRKRSLVGLLIAEMFGVSIAQPAANAYDGDGGSGSLVKKRFIESFKTLDERRQAAKALPKVLSNQERKQLREAAKTAVEQGIEDPERIAALAGLAQARDEHAQWMLFYLRVAAYQQEQLRALADQVKADLNDEEEALALLLL